MKKEEINYHWNGFLEIAPEDYLLGGEIIPEINLDEVMRKPSKLKRLICTFIK